MDGAALDRDSILKLIEFPLAGQKPLVEGLLCLDEQIQPCGLDLTLRSVSLLKSAGRMGSAPDDRELSDLEEVEFGEKGWLFLPEGSYLLTFNEVVNIPLDLMALCLPRSSLLRSGVSLHTAVWDPGYNGRSQALLIVHTSHGYQVQLNARLLQLVFFRLVKPVEQGYDGRYQGERP